MTTVLKLIQNMQKISKMRPSEHFLAFRICMVYLISTTVKIKIADFLKGNTHLFLWEGVVVIPNCMWYSI
jgi:hypothetical protein